MKKINVLAILVFLTGTAFAQTWTLDKAHAKVGFSTTHMMISDVEGSFKTFDATLTSAKPDLSDATFDFTADVNSVNTDQEKRDAHLKSPDFFDAAKYPTITFKSTSFKKVDGKNYQLAGNLTMHGVTKPVEFALVLNGPLTHPFDAKKTIAGVKVTGKINRKDFAVGEKMGAAVISEEVTIVANAEFGK
jgi:polyisoprenoid-binding protein YceI